jgi:hypothetical protein
MLKYFEFCREHLRIVTRTFRMLLLELPVPTLRRSGRFQSFAAQSNHERIKHSGTCRFSPRLLSRLEMAQGSHLTSYQVCYP